jgi:hypothetical protein
VMGVDGDVGACTARHVKSRPCPSYSQDNPNTAQRMPSSGNSQLRTCPFQPMPSHPMPGPAHTEARYFQAPSLLIQIHGQPMQRQANAKDSPCRAFCMNISRPCLAQPMTSQGHAQPCPSTPQSMSSLTNVQPRPRPYQSSPAVPQPCK